MPPPGYGEQPPPPGYGTPVPPEYGTAPTPPGKPPEEECPKPDDQLKKLKTALEKQEAHLTALGKQRDSLSEDLKGLEQIVTELAAVLAAYREACKALHKQKSELTTYVAVKTPMLEAAIGDKRKPVEQCISAIEEWLASWKKYATQLEAKARSSADVAAQASEAAAEAQKRYDELKTSAATLDKQLKALDALRTQMEQEDDKNKIARMFFLLRELRNGLAAIKLRTPEELERELCLAWTALSKAKEHARATKSASEAAREAADRAKTKATDAETKRRELILTCIDKACPPPPPAPANC